MEKERNILLFLDLEGTILQETKDEYDHEEMYHFLGQLDYLQTITNASVRIHLVSPVHKKQMVDIIDRIDRDIIRYNKLHPEHKDIPEIECGSFTPERGISSEEPYRNKVLALKMPLDSRQIDTSKYGKSNYVKQWCEMYEEKNGLFMIIYGGNGINDLSAMEYVRKQKSGFVICPSNSRPQAQSKSDFVSESRELRGISEGIGYINQEITKRRNKEIPTENLIPNID